MCCLHKCDVMQKFNAMPLGKVFIEHQNHKETLQKTSMYALVVAWAPVGPKQHAIELID